MGDHKAERTSGDWPRPELFSGRNERGKVIGLGSASLLGGTMFFDR